MDQIDPSHTWREHCHFNGITPTDLGNNTFYRGCNKRTFEDGTHRAFWNPVKVPCLDEQSREGHRLTYVVSHGSARSSQDDYFSSGFDTKCQTTTVLGYVRPDLVSNLDVKYGPRAFHLPHRPLVAPVSVRESREVLQRNHSDYKPWSGTRAMFVPTRGDQVPKRRESRDQEWFYLEQMRQQGSFGYITSSA